MAFSRVLTTGLSRHSSKTPEGRLLFTREGALPPFFRKTARDFSVGVHSFVDKSRPEAQPTIKPSRAFFRYVRSHQRRSTLRARPRSGHGGVACPSRP